MKTVIGDPLVINGRTLSLSRAIRAGDFVYLTGQIPMQDGVVMTEGTIEQQTQVVLEAIKATLALADCSLSACLIQQFFQACLVVHYSDNHK